MKATTFVQFAINTDKLFPIQENWKSTSVSQIYPKNHKFIEILAEMRPIADPPLQEVEEGSPARFRLDLFLIMFLKEI